MNLEEIKAREQAAMNVLARAELSYDAEYRPLLESVSDIKRLIAEVERLTAENASGKEANESCRQYIETLKKELHAAVETADMWTDAYNKQCEENTTLKKVLELACESLKWESTRSLNSVEFLADYFIHQAQQTHETHGVDK